MRRQRLYINVDHVATVRQARRGAEPDPVAAALACEAAGADGITAHLREDRTGSGCAPPRAFRSVPMWSMLTPRRRRLVMASRS